MIKIEFKNGETKEFNSMKEAEQYEKSKNTKFFRIIKK